MKVYVVMGGCTGDEHVIAVYSTPELAKSRADEENQNCRGLDAHFEEWSVMTPRRTEILNLVALEEETAEIWPWAATAEEISQDDEKLSAVEAMLHYSPDFGCDTDQVYQAIEQVFGLNPILSKNNY